MTHRSLKPRLSPLLDIYEFPEQFRRWQSLTLRAGLRVLCLTVKKKQFSTTFQAFFDVIENLIRLYYETRLYKT